ncbi:MAG: Verru_Chthon cassette protein A [Verrucomicrobia bacterium]|nr:Verru_Chthon cassette protein A [Verrucomicrobiota bacterium]
MAHSVTGHRIGAALVMTLGMLVLLSGVVLAFLLMVKTEYGASKAYEGGTNARLLADSALNLVIGQIREASTQPDLAWISQPGLLRTFDTSGKAVKSYKLYSADSLVEDGSFDPAKGADLPSASGANSWKTQPGLWTDLNQPAADLVRTDPFDSTKKKRLMVYPIFDGNHINTAGQLSLNKDGNQDVEGLTVDQFSTRGVTMPVKWLYILKDGTLVPAKASGTAGDVEVVVPTDRQKTAQGEANTVVGRVAFWADDETAKVNINTAAEGTFSDTPVGNSQPGMVLPAVNYQTSNDSTFEWDLAERMGAQKEYQRYPGHPATTCLSTIFGRQLTLLVGNTGNTSTDRALMIEEINKMIPRVTGAYYSDPFYSYSDYDYSSKGGTKRAGPAQGQFNQGQSSLDETTYPVVPDGDRLYASIDEFLFSPMFATTRRAWSLAPPASARDTTREMLEISKFFLTANSKAPEQNSFNLPRISVWPEQVADARRTAVDKLIAFCATVGPKTGTNTLPFYFTRQDANSPTADVTGTSGARNLALMAYLKGLTARQYPGWNSTKTFKDKYGVDRDQILTEIFDYIRCTNLADRSDPNAPDSAFTNTVENGATQVFPSVPSLGMGSRGQVAPIEMPDGTRGMGRIITISELALVMIGNNDKVEFSLIPKLFSPMAGFSALSMGMRITFTKIDIVVKDASGGAGRNPFTQDGVTVSSQPTLYDIGRMSNVEDNEGKIGGTLGFHSICEGGTGRKPQNQGSPSESVPPTGEMAVTGSQLTISGTVTAELSVTNPSSGPRSSGEPVYQTITFKFPSQTVPVPGSGNEMAAGGTGAKSRGGRIAGANGAGIDGNDTIRSLVAVGKNLQGDMRIVAATKNVDETYFQPAPNGAYQDSAQRNNQNHSLRSGWPGNYAGSAFGQLEASITQYGGEGQPDIPAGISGVVNSLGQPGDWDNGPAFLPDGPYCNKPDEGTRRHQHAQGPYAEDSTPYIGWWWNPQDTMQQQTTFFSPNRLISSPVMFGSLPTGVKAYKPWQTLLFRPAKGYFPGGTNHPGSASGGAPPDHLLLDLFWMPVAEPYAISEPFATAGKINLNQQIAPFTNIRRDTGLRAVMKSVKISALNPNQPDGAGGVYSQRYKLCGTVGLGGSSGGGRGVVTRRNIDLDNTLKQIADRYATNKPFVSASEICDIPLIPQDLPTVATMQQHVSVGFSSTTPLSQFDSLLGSFWSQHKLTGDNSLERPYSHIYPRLTTRSNTYTVHVRVQMLARNTRNSGYILKASQSQPTGEFRGSFLLERYLDANSASIVDSAGTPKAVPASGDTTSLALGPYRFRIVSSKQFVP